MILAGDVHTAAIKTDGSLWAWGGDSDERSLPIGEYIDNIRYMLPFKAYNPNTADIGVGAYALLLAVSAAGLAGLCIPRRLRSGESLHRPSLAVRLLRSPCLAGGPPPFDKGG